jgi:putative two-component system response regulator
MESTHATLDRPCSSRDDPRAATVMVVGPVPFLRGSYENLLRRANISLVGATRDDALPELRRDHRFDLVLIDAIAEQYGALELCRSIKQDQKLHLLPVVILVGRDQEIMRSVGLRWGADDCVTTPDQNGELFHRCRNLIRTRQATNVLENSEKVLFTLARLIEGRDRYTHGHVERVSAYSVELGKRMGLSNGDIVALQKGGIIHDVGKIVVPDAILNKPGPLSNQDWEIVRRHPIVGHDLLAPLHTFESVLPIVRWHHERPNGTGYPDGIGGVELPLIARIVAVADCFDALSTARPYHEPYSVEESLGIMAEAAARDDFDRQVVALLVETQQKT